MRLKADNRLLFMSPDRIPCIIFEDEHLLVICKPAGIATHRAAENAPWGIVEFLQSHRPDLPVLGIHQRLDRETSGVQLFAKSAEANRSFANQFEQRKIRKKYFFVTNGLVSIKNFTATEPIDRKEAKTHFKWLHELSNGGSLWEALPETGRTHQVRIHAAKHKIPIIGDIIRGSPPHDTERDLKRIFEPLLLHAAQLEFLHPTTQNHVCFAAPLPPYFECPDIEKRRLLAAIILRKNLLDEQKTNAFRLIHREADDFPNLTVDYLNSWLYVENFASSIQKDTEQNTHLLFSLLTTQNPEPGTQNFAALSTLNPQPSTLNSSGLILSHALQGIRRQDKQLIFGKAPPEGFYVIENGVKYHLEPLAPGGIGLFLDQRENRRHIQSLSSNTRVLNLFAYTCAFSVAAALGGALETVNVDLSRRVLEWGQKNFHLNGLDPQAHQFIIGDVFEVIKRFHAKKETFDLVIIDPPSFSRSKKNGSFSVKQDFKQLAQNAAALVKKNGQLFCSTNLAGWKSDDFLNQLQAAIDRSKRKIIQKLWIPQPFDFPATAVCPTYLKTVWLQLD